MSASPTGRLRTELNSFFAAFWPSMAPSQARFGHIHLPPYRPSGGKLSQEIHRSVSSVRDSARLFLIVPETEMKIAVSNGELFEPCQRAPVVMTYASFLAALPSFRTEDRAAWNPQSREDGEIVVVFHIDPTFPADCSLALIALVHWAMDVSSDRGIMRVITMSSDRNCNELEHLVAIRDPNMAVDQLDVASLGAQDPVGDAFVSKAGDHYAIASEILEIAVANPERPQTIISFEGKSFLKALLKRMEQTHQGPIEVTSVEDDTSIALLMEYVGSSDRLPNLRLLEMDPCLPVLPMTLMGDSVVHVVLGSSYSPSLPWDAKSEEAVPVETSREQQTAQVWWAHQPRALQRYIYTGGCDVASFLEGYGLRHRLIDSSQLGGFVASVVDSRWLGIDPRSTIWCMTRHPRHAEKMMEELEARGVISDFGLALPEQEAVDFRRALPLVKYDYRLALFIARQSTPMARAFKIQLAAVLTTGVRKVATVETGVLPHAANHLDRPGQDPRWGFGRTLDGQDALWFALERWTRVANPSRTPHGRQTMYAGLNGIVKFQEPSMSRVKRLVLDLSQALDAQTMDRIHDMGPEGLRQFSGHMISALFSQLEMNA